jgi:hypothetical protein
VGRYREGYRFGDTIRSAFSRNRQGGKGSFAEDQRRWLSIEQLAREFVGQVLNGISDIKIMTMLGTA